MIQFNLLPNVKLEYIRAAKAKRLVISISVLVVAVVLIIVGLLTMNVVVFQNRHIGNLNADIDKYTAELEGTTDINKILTIQNQLDKLPALHDQKPEASRLFTYLTQLTPADIVISELNIVFTETKIEISGDAQDIADVNRFVDTLKFTDYREDVEGAEAVRAFSEVVLEDFTVANEVSFGISLKYDPIIFDITKNVELIVPDITSTRSAVEKPADVFQESSEGEL